MKTNNSLAQVVEILLSSILMAYLIFKLILPNKFTFLKKILSDLVSFYCQLNLDMI